jgi:coenzyme F420-0:L-glutamate ligase / coenzyme F420-1:gamma-L-glutamate ligase
VIEVVPLEGIPEVRPGDDLAAFLADALDRAGGLREGDVLVVSQKVVSKAEGRVEQAADHVEVILREARTVRRRRDELIIAETQHGFVCASAGVDRSNTPGDDWVVLLPRDPDASAGDLRDALGARFGTAPSVIVSDSFGRAWRKGTTEVALGAAGVTALLDLNGALDAAGYELHATQIARADELASAAELVLGKLDRVPAAVIRGVDAAGEGTGRDLVMPPERDLFR